MKFKIFLPLLTLFLLFAGCQTPPTPVTPPTSEPTSVLASTPTSVPLPTATEIAPLGVASTQTPSLDPAVVDLPTLVMAANPRENLFTSVSTDGQWQIEIVRYDCVQVDPTQEGENAYEQIILTRLNEGNSTVVAEQLQYCGGLGAYGFNDFYWSPNSRYYYFSHARIGSPDGQLCWLWDGEFSRVDVETNLVERVPANGTQVSSDGFILGWDETEIVIWNQNEGESGRVPFVETTFTLQSLQISPDGSRFVYLLGDTCAPNTGTHSIVVLGSLADQTQTVLLDSENLTYTYVQWENDTLLLLATTDGHEQHFDLNTNELILLTPPAP